VKLHKELEHDTDNDESKQKDSKRKEIKDTRRKRKSQICAPRKESRPAQVMAV
jgi:hypothetical protein